MRICCSHLRSEDGQLGRLLAMASKLIAMASNLLAMASNPKAMASNLLAY